MSQTGYTPLNGKEIRETLKSECNKVIDTIPLLRIGNTFHGAILELGFRMSAKPADVPVPKPQEFKIELEAPDFSDNPEAQEIVKRTDLYLEDLKRRKEEINLQLDSEIRKYEDETFSFVDANIPDQVRVDHGLDVPVTEKTSTGMRETYKPASTIANAVSFNKK